MRPLHSSHTRLDPIGMVMTDVMRPVFGSNDDDTLGGSAMVKVGLFSYSLSRFSTALFTSRSTAGRPGMSADFGPPLHFGISSARCHFSPGMRTNLAWTDVPVPSRFE